MRRCLIPVLVAVLTASVTAELRAIRRVPPGAGGPGTVNLPYTINDQAGNNWYIYQNGSFRQQNNMPIYSQGGILLINGNHPNQNNNLGRMEEKTGELIIENMQAQNCIVTRRIQVNKEEGYIRVIDILKNNQAQDVTIQAMVQTQLNYSVNTSTMVADPKIKTQNIGWSAMTGANRAVTEIFCGRGSKVAPQLNYQNGNSYIQGNFNLTIPAGKEIALMHVHTTAASQEAGAKWIAAIKETKLMADIPAAIRKIIVNFRAGMSFIGDTEVLRGEMLDVVELRGGDSLKGTIKIDKFNLKTFYGPVELPADSVIGMINVGEYRPRQLLVTKDGEIFGGELQAKEISIALSSGQVTPVPLAQITRLGYRKRDKEPEEWTFDKPMVLLRSGERMMLQLPKDGLDVLTRYGKLKLDTKVLAAVAFQAEEHGVHQIYLTDGSKFAGLVMADSFEMKLAAGDQTVKFPASGISRIQFNSKVDEMDEASAMMNLANDDLLVGAIASDMKLDPAFGTISLSAGEVRKLSRAKGGSTQDVQVVLWDDTNVSGQLQETEVAVRLKCGVEIKVPVALVEDYNQPRPQPSQQVAKEIAKLVGDLSADDWQVRDEAQKKLAAMGTVVIKSLKELRPKQSPEGQQRIDQIIKDLEKTEKTTGAAGTAPPPGAVPVPQIIECDFPIPQGVQIFQPFQQDCIQPVQVERRCGG